MPKSFRFFRRQKKYSELLHTILSEYNKSFHSDPYILRKAIDPIEIWRFFVEADCQHDLDGSWMDFEDREKNYLLSLFYAFHTIFNPKQTLTLEFIKNLHLTSTFYTKSTNYDKNLYKLSFCKKGEFRRTNIGYSLSRKNSSQEGIEELLHKMDRQKGAFYNYFINDDGSYPGWSIQSKDKTSLASRIYNHILHHKLWLINDRKFLHSPLKDTIQLLNADMQKLLDDVHLKLNLANNKVKKLRIIVTFIQDCAQLHPFIDGNGRTFYMLLFNFLLIQNGFPLAILRDPNQFELFSIDELMLEAINGMQNTFDLIKNKVLFDVSSSKILKRYTTPQQALYFEKIVKIEEENRTPQVYRPFKSPPISAPTNSFFWRKTGLFTIGGAIGLYTRMPILAPVPALAEAAVDYLKDKCKSPPNFTLS